MRVFLTGATGFVGSAVAQDLVQTGHEVLGFARSDAAAAALSAQGIKVQRGDLEDLDSLRRGAEAADGVIHTGFVHDFSRFQAVCEIDRRAIEALGSVLAGSGRPLIVTSGTALVSPGRVATENDVPVMHANAHPRSASDQQAAAVANQGVRVSIVRLSPSVHGDNDHGFVPMLIKLAREKGVSAYVGEGLNRWTAVHRLDGAPLYRLALEKGTSGARYHGVAEEEIPFREIARRIGERLKLPVVAKSVEEAAEHFGWIAAFAGLDCPASSTQTRAQLGWAPTHPGLLTDLENSATYFRN